jgi:hypothetical protein
MVTKTPAQMCAEINKKIKHGYSIEVCYVDGSKSDYALFDNVGNIVHGYGFLQGILQWAHIHNLLHGLEILSTDDYKELQEIVQEWTQVLEANEIVF